MHENIYANCLLYNFNDYQKLFIKMYIYSNFTITTEKNMAIFKYSRTQGGCY